MSAPVKNTCPDIDKAIKKIKKAYTIARDARCRFEKGTDEYIDFSDIEDELMFLEGDLEDLREDNAKLRDWGESLEDQLQVAAEEINNLENKIEQLNNITP